MLKRKRNPKLNLLIILEIELEQLISEEIFNVHMIQSGLVKFLKFLEDSYDRVNQYTI